ncbi:elongation factor 4 [Candidatus Parcubacteria bacterium]|jgi:GTP-binding protein LepA|nr:MAG: elongation factor 4 [Candidatus Parcubacteria bacterium]
MQTNYIRNFCIIAHIDHGKSTLADRFLELTGTVSKREMRSQILDQMDIERERGITIKLAAVRMRYQYNQQDYELNLIDTPGHVDFAYEVSRSLAAVEGAILLVDATQGVEAQTLANLYLALEQNLEIIPAINKIDLPNARVEECERELTKLLGCQNSDILKISAKSGAGVKVLLEKVIEKIPAPVGEENRSLQALVFDSKFDDYRGVITFVRIVQGQIVKGESVKFLATDAQGEALEVGYFQPKFIPAPSLKAGEIGYVVTGVKSVADARVGDTLTSAINPALRALPGYKHLQPMVFASLFTKAGDDFPLLKEALGKLKLNDAALSYEVEHSQALGHGFRCGFLGLLHLDIVQERLRREYNLDLIVTVPSVAYKVFLNESGLRAHTRKVKEQSSLHAAVSGAVIITSPLDLPESTHIDHIEEPWVKADIVMPTSTIGGILSLIVEKRGRHEHTEYLDAERVIIHARLPLAGILVDFYDRLKSVSSGYASLNYEISGSEKAEVTRLDILVANEKVDALAVMVYQDEAYAVGRQIVDHLKAILPRQMFEVKIQAVLGAKVIASASLPAMRKDVTAKLYGGDVTRKIKLLEKQKKGKRKMKSLGKVEIPQAAFFAVLKRD